MRHSTYRTSCPCHPDRPSLTDDRRIASSFVDRITFNPEQCGGRPCVRGMRIRVKDVLDLLAARVPESEILADYPDQEPEDIQACIQYAAEQLDHPVLVTER